VSGWNEIDAVGLDLAAAPTWEEGAWRALRARYARYSQR